MIDEMVPTVARRAQEERGKEHERAEGARQQAATKWLAHGT